MSHQVTLSTKISDKVKQELQEFCEEKGLKMNKFIERALKEKLVHERSSGPPTEGGTEFFDEEAWKTDWELKEMDAYDKF